MVCGNECNAAIVMVNVNWVDEWSACCQGVKEKIMKSHSRYWFWVSKASLQLISYYDGKFEQYEIYFNNMKYHFKLHYLERKWCMMQSIFIICLLSESRCIWAIRMRLVNGCSQEVAVDEVIGWAKNKRFGKRLPKVSSWIFIVNTWRHLWIRWTCSYVGWRER
jgi:hypothetical protein